MVDVPLFAYNSECYALPVIGQYLAVYVGLGILFVVVVVVVFACSLLFLVSSLVTLLSRRIRCILVVLECECVCAHGCECVCTRV